MNNSAGIPLAGSFCLDYNLKAFDILDYQSIIMELCIQHRMDEGKENRLE